MSRPGRLELAEYEMQKACKQNRKIPHPFVQFRQRRQAVLHSIYQWVYARARLVGRTAGGQNGRRQASRQQAETGSPKRSFRTTNDLHTRRQKKKERTKEVQQKGDAIYFSSFSSHSKLQGSLASLLDTKFCSAASKKFAPSSHAPSATQRLAPPRLPPLTTRQSYVLVSFPIGPRVKKKLLQLLLAKACLLAPGKVPVYFFRGIRKKSRQRLALLYPLIQPRKARLNPSLIRRWDVKLKFGRGQMEQQYSLVLQQHNG